MAVVVTDAITSSPVLERRHMVPGKEPESAASGLVPLPVRTGSALCATGSLEIPTFPTSNTISSYATAYHVGLALFFSPS